MIVWIAVACVIIAFFMGRWISGRGPEEGGAPGPETEEGEAYLRSEWGIPLPPGNPALGIFREGVLAYRATLEELQACRDQHDGEWLWLGDQERISNDQFTVNGDEMRVEYRAWDRADGKINVICLCYNALLVYLIVDPPVTKTDNQEQDGGDES